MFEISIILNLNISFPHEIMFKAPLNNNIFNTKCVSKLITKFLSSFWKKIICILHSVIVFILYYVFKKPFRYLYGSKKSLISKKCLSFCLLSNLQISTILLQIYIEHFLELIVIFSHNFRSDFTQDYFWLNDLFLPWYIKMKWYSFIYRWMTLIVLIQENSIVENEVKSKG